VKSLYNKLSSEGIDRSFKQLWKSRIPLKIKIWLWLIWQNAIATKDNMKKRKWVGSFDCHFCPDDETINHLFFTCPMAAYIWSTISTVLDHIALHNISGGLLKFYLLVIICILWGLQLYVGPFGKLEINLVLRAS
jgi:hypothetical protein